MAKSILAALMLALLLCGCGGGGSSSHPATLSSITVNAASLTGGSTNSVTMAPDTTAQFTAIGNFSDGSTADLTGSVTWSSANTAVATVETAAGSQGLVSALAIGSSTITATSGTISGTVTVNVAAPQSITVTPPPSGPILVGTTLQFSAAGHFAGGAVQALPANQVTWSADPAVATISTQGLASFVGPGNAPGITASLGGVSSAPVNFSVVTVQSVALSPTNPTLDSGATQTFTAVATLSDASTISSPVTWSSANPAVVSVIGTTGVATARVPGSTTITATFPGGTAGTTTVTVLAPTRIDVTPANQTLAAGSTQQFSAIGTFADGTQDLTDVVSWNSSQAAAGSISNQAGSRGLFSAPVNASGATIVTATLTGSPAGSTSLTVKSLTSLAVTPANLSVARNSVLQMTATATFSDGTTQDLTDSATWSTNGPAVATVSNTAGTRGLVSGVALGSATISAAVAGRSASTLVTVTATPAVVPTNRAFVTNFGSRNVTVIDTSNPTNPTLLPPITVGNGPRGIAFNAENKQVYVANSSDGTLSVIDLATNAVATVTLPGGGGPWGVAVLPGRVYVTNSMLGTVSVVNTSNNRVQGSPITVGSLPKGIAVNPANNRVYVANSNDGTVTVIDGNSNAVIGSPITVTPGVDHLALDAAGHVYATSSASTTVFVINPATNPATVTSFNVGNIHKGLAIDTTTGRAYLSNSTGTVSVVNTATNTELSTPRSPVGVGSDPRGIAVKSNRAYVVNNVSNNVSVLDTTGDSNTVLAPIGAGSGPTEIAVIP